jgi:hypothetical protein
MQFTRFLRNGSVTVAEMMAHARSETGQRVAGREVVVVQDTSEVVLGGRRARARGFGPVGGGGVLSGVLLHAVLAVEAGPGGGLLGLVAGTMWNREGGQRVGPRRHRATSEKESQRWLDGTARAAEALASASRITMVADRESDIYELFAKRPSNVDLVVRVAQDRRIETEGEESGLLFAFADGLPEQGRLRVSLSALPGRPAREADCAVRYSSVVLRKPLHGAARDLPKSVTLTLVDVREISCPVGASPLHWRIFTTREVSTLDQARRVRDLYRQRWMIEEFFRSLKSGGFDIEDAEIGEPRALINFVGAATVAAVTAMQLVQARDGTTGQSLSDAFDLADQPILEAVSAKLEGKTKRQKNPHPKGSLAFASWVIARLGGWTGYYGKPGPRVMNRGLTDFQQIRYGTTLGLQDV